MKKTRLTSFPPSKAIIGSLLTSSDNVFIISVSIYGGFETIISNLYNSEISLKISDLKNGSSFY